MVACSRVLTPDSMIVSTELWHEYCMWCRENKNKGYTSVYAPDFVEFMSWVENKENEYVKSLTVYTNSKDIKFDNTGDFYTGPVSI